LIAIVVFPAQIIFEGIRSDAQGLAEKIRLGCHGHFSAFFLQSYRLGLRSELQCFGALFFRTI